MTSWFLAALLFVGVVGCGESAAGGVATREGEGGSGGGSTSSASSASSGGSGPATGSPCNSNADCAEQDFCDWDLCLDGLCGDCDRPGVCKPRPAQCKPRDDDTLTCACDGIVYPSGCEASRAGVRAGGYSGTACATPPGTFRCGDDYCIEGGACVDLDIGDGGPWLECIDLPTGCDPTDCACFIDSLWTTRGICCSSCEDVGHLSLTCSNYETGPCQASGP